MDKKEIVNKFLNEFEVTIYANASILSEKLTYISVYWNEKLMFKHVEEGVFIGLDIAKAYIINWFRYYYMDEPNGKKLKNKYIKILLKEENNG